MKKPNTQNKKTTTWLKLKVKILTDTLCHMHVKYVLIVNMLLLFWSLSMKNMPIYFSINISSICNTLVNKHTANLLVFFCQKFTLELPPLQLLCLSGIIRLYEDYWPASEPSPLQPLGWGKCRWTLYCAEQQRSSGRFSLLRHSDLHLESLPSLNWKTRQKPLRKQERRLSTSWLSDCAVENLRKTTTTRPPPRSSPLT